MQVGRCQGGFGYIFLLILTAIFGSASIWSVQVAESMQRQHAEKELLRIGDEFSKALQSYRSASVIGSSGGPAALTDLLIDPRFPFKKRHIRKIFSDPMTGGDDWGLVLSSDQKIIGIFSKSNEKPIMQLQLPGKDDGHATSYAHWVFGATDAWYAEQGLSKPCRCN